MTSLAQSSTSSTQTNTIVIDGKRYVLVPEATFSKIEKLTDEMPLAREQIKALEAGKANDAEIIAKQETLLQLKDKTIEADEKALAASEKARELEKEAGAKDREALEKAQARITELEGKVKRANRRTVFALIGAAAIFLLGGN